MSKHDKESIFIGIVNFGCFTIFGKCLPRILNWVIIRILAALIKNGI
jgi:hypothetical protein